MKRLRLKDFILTSIFLFLFSSLSFANNLPFENYKLGIGAFEEGDWVKAETHFDAVIMQDLAYSEYLAKSIYFKTIILTAQVERDLKMEEFFIRGEGELALDNREEREEFRALAQSYRAASQRRVDTLIGLNNYLLNNLPPLNIEVSKIAKVYRYDSALASNIQSGTMIEGDNIKRLEEDILTQKVNKYLDLTLGVDSFDNTFSIRAKEGDNLHYFSKEYEVPLRLLIDVNSHIDNPNLIYPDQKIFIPRVNRSSINYPAYFYYLSDISYKANPERSDEITRLVFKAYELTGQNKAQSQVVDSVALIEEFEVDQYSRRLSLQEEKIGLQREEIERLKNMYQKLIKDLQSSQEEPSDEDDEDVELLFDQEDYNPTNDPLYY